MTDTHKGWWTIANVETGDFVPPMDDSGVIGSDDPLMVFRTREGAESVAKAQSDLYELHTIVVPLPDSPNEGTPHV